eukprot:1341561-Lingulodinium_polyedra.AAC.1
MTSQACKALVRASPPGLANAIRWSSSFCRVAGSTIQRQSATRGATDCLTERARWEMIAKVFGSV